MTYAGLESVNTTEDLSNIFIYVNSITDGVFVPLMLFAFFMIIMLGSSFMQFRFTGRIRPESSFAAAAFSSFGFAVILSTKNGLLSPNYLFISIALAIIAAFWLYFSSD